MASSVCNNMCDWDATLTPRAKQAQVAEQVEHLVTCWLVRAESQHVRVVEDGRIFTVPKNRKEIASTHFVRSRPV